MGLLGGVPVLFLFQVGLNSFIAMKEITAFKCEFCGKLYKIKGTCKRHELYCGKNPINKFECLDSCQHLVVGRKDIGGISIKTFYCEKLRKNYKTHIAVKRNLALDLPLMPLKCKHYVFKMY